MKDQLQPPPLVSVVAVTYNLIENNRLSSFIQCINSVHSLTNGQIEHLVIDGASTDGTLDELKKYQYPGWICLSF